MNKKYLWLYILFNFLCAFTPSVLGQTYGLKFQGQNVTLDKRTELNVTPTDFLRFQDEFEISFDIKFDLIEPNWLFGYIFRVINQENINVDLISTPDPSAPLNLVIGKNNEVVPVSQFNNSNNQWNNLRLKFMLSQNRLVFYLADTFYVHNDIGFKNQDAFKIIFGANDYEQFNTTDVPSMSIKNLQISEKGVLKYAWHLDETEGFITRDRINRQEAHVKNPVWLRLTHQVWQSEFEKEADGPVMVAFDENNERIFIVGTDELWIYSAEGNTIEQIRYNKKVNFNPNTYCAIFNSSDNKIYCYVVDSESVYTIDIVSGEWNQHEIASQLETKFRHHNRFYRQSNNSIYLFGGYGFHKYSNEIRKIDVTSMSVSNLPSNMDVFHPRYLAGLGELNDTVYILGGYGSTTGDQLINPQSYYDLFGYSLENGDLFKKFEIPQIIDNMALANTLWIDPEKRSYYALIFGKSKFDGHLQLVKGNLDAPKIETVGNRIPFQFLDIRSFSSLFYFPVQKKLFAYTSYLSENNKARVSLYSISYPPDNFSINDSGNNAIGSQIAYSLIFFILLLSGVFIFIYRKRKRRKPSDLIQETKIPAENSPGNDLSNSLLDKNKYHIILFGGFQVYNKNFKDITSYFSPLLKELFLLIFLYSFKNNKGISSEKITEILWFDKSEKSARNNRAVNIAKLRGLLEEMGFCELSKKTGYWKISFEDTQINSDYFDFLSITSSKKNLTKQKVTQLIEISQKGGFLVNAHYEWLDEFKAQVADTIMDTLVEYGQKADIKAEAEFIINLAECIFNFDIVNEEAMILKCKAQYCMGKHSHSKATYEKFFKEYSTMYNQEYDKAFTEIINPKE